MKELMDFNGPFSLLLSSFLFFLSFIVCPILTFFFVNWGVAKNFNELPLSCSYVLTLTSHLSCEEKGMRGFWVLGWYMEGNKKKWGFNDRDCVKLVSQICVLSSQKRNEGINKFRLVFFVIWLLPLVFHIHMEI